MWDETPVWKRIALVFISCSLIILSSETTPSVPLNNGGLKGLFPLLRGNKRGEDFLSEYWKRPIYLQVPSSESGIGLSFYPESCGECHKKQYEGWKESLHSRAVGQGLLSQIDPHNDSETAVSCYYCHAPMMEQSEVVKQKPALSEVEGTEDRRQK